MKVERFIFGPFETNCYVVSDDQQLLLIDPACAYEWEQQELLRYIQPLTANRSPLTVIATHGHLDHLWGAKWATETWHTPVLMHEADIPMARAMQQQYDLFGVRATAEVFPMEPLNQQFSIFNYSDSGSYTGLDMSIFSERKDPPFRGYIVSNGLWSYRPAGRQHGAVD